MEIAKHRPFIYKFSFIYDIIAGIGLTNPWTYALLYKLVAQLNAAVLGSPPEMANHMAGDIFFANIGGLALCAWAVARAMRYHASFLLIDGVLKILIVAAQIVAVMAGAPAILLGLGIVLFLIGALELLAYMRLRRGHATVNPMR